MRCVNMELEMAEVILTNGMIAHIDDADLPKVQGYRWRLYNNGAQRYVQADARILNKDTTIRLHRLVTDKRFLGSKTKFRDGNPLNCRKANIVPIKLAKPRSDKWTRSMMAREAAE